MRWTTLIDTDELLAAPARGDWAVVDCRFDLADPEAGRRAWQRAHIPGAFHADLDHDLSGPVTGSTGRHPLPDPDALVAWLERHGIGNETQIVVYDDGPGAMAARFWWLMRWLGHEAVAVLDGGLAAWRDAGGALTDETPEPSHRSRYRAHPGSMPVVGTETLAGTLDGFCVVDARSRERYRGDAEPIDPVAGHVPGALSRPVSANLGDDGRFLPVSELRGQWSQILDRASGRPVVAICGSGVSACHHVLALAHAGLAEAALNPGSWSEWIRDPNRPVATGEEA
ncbi:putative thiosulfate sulfurtransferase SseB [wastewater metagenome]|uniref:Putative thiosulfate sulfurtransferase SseB n=2 Tax=unclassified sequences TaxID=12908 RepID=A0A5B8RE90_9ZZZZ|nr:MULTISPECIES: sulfurtransferase [Arhodomonas]MCS4504981.1 sulfurtransferase [Arhodomonas aquaeolei]QEA05057.1 putative thiosulfate sulfurtransferase SseB [uncultured organism]